VKAAVLATIGEALEVRTDVEVAPPQAGEVSVRMAASGVCHSDLSMRDGVIPAATPMILGHEGAGVIEAVGDGVSAFAPGDHVVISWTPQCGDCYWCVHGQPYMCDVAVRASRASGMLDGTTRATSQGQELRQMAFSGTFAELTVVPAISVVKIPDDFPLPLAALLGCGVLTGVGAALNTADIAPGDTVAVIGCGGVGLNVIQGARIAGAGEIIAIDLHPAKLELARQFGATHTIDSSSADGAAGDTVRAVRELTDRRGADVSFEVIGLAATIEQAVKMTRRGGQVVLVGVPSRDVHLDVEVFADILLQERKILGCWYGSSDPQRDIPRLIDRYREGSLMLDELVSRTIDLEDVNDAFAAMERGEVARSVIGYPPPR
jgi:S-(hydroxymethyl)glutathione dehydrogenase / alcohol dehydrogenase